MSKYVRQIDLETMREYGEFFKSMRESVGMTVAEMAEELGVFRTTIVRWERGETVPNRDIYDLEQDIRYIVKRSVALEHK